MDFRDPKVQKISMVAIAFIIVVYFWHARMYAPKAEAITQKTEERERMVTKLKNVEMKAKSLEDLKKEYGDLLDRYHDIEALLPEVKQIPSYLVQLHTASVLSNCKITKLEPQETQSESFYDAAKFKVELTGSYHGFGQFMSYCANFPFITNITEMDLKTILMSNGQVQAPQSSNEKLNVVNPETVVASFLLSTYYVRPESRLQEIAFEGVK